MDDLRRSMDDRLSSGDGDAYVDLEIELEKQLMAQAAAQFRRGSFGEAADCWDTVADLNRELVGALTRASSGATNAINLQKYDAAALTREADSLALFSEGQAQIARGQGLMLQRNADAAGECLGAAREVFLRAAERGRGAGEVFAGYAGALKEHAAGLEEMMRSDFASAAQMFMRARVAMDKLLNDTLPAQMAGAPHDTSLAGLEPILRSEASAIGSQYEKSSFMARMAAGEYDGALQNAEGLARLLQESLDSLPHDAPAWQRYSIRAELASANADAARASAFVLRQAGRWDEAQAAYERAREELTNAANLYLQTELPNAAANQETVLAVATVVIAPEARQALVERRLTESIHELQAERRGLVERISSAGVTVNNFVDAIATAESNTQIAVQVTQSVKDLLPDLRAALEQVDLGGARGELERQIAALEGSEEAPKSFLERAKVLTGQVAAVVKNVGEAAAPVIPVVRLLAALVGVPLPF